MPIEKTLSILELTTSEGIGGILVIFTLPVIVIYNFIERFFTIKKAAEEDENFMIRIKGLTCSSYGTLF